MIFFRRFPKVNFVDEIAANGHGNVRNVHDLNIYNELPPKDVLAASTTVAHSRLSDFPTTAPSEHTHFPLISAKQILMMER